MKLMLRILCVQPPAPEERGALFGLQENTKEGYTILPGEILANGDRVFTCECEVKQNPKTKLPNFLGACINGTPTERFLYITWHPQEGHPDLPDPIGPFGYRRMKIPLKSITMEQIEEVERTGGALETAVAGTAPNGGIYSGTVPLLGEGWTVRPT